MLLSPSLPSIYTLLEYINMLLVRYNIYRLSSIFCITMMCIITSLFLRFHRFPQPILYCHRLRQLIDQLEVPLRSLENCAVKQIVIFASRHKAVLRYL